MLIIEAVRNSATITVTQANHRIVVRGPPRTLMALGATAQLDYLTDFVGPDDVSD